MKKIFDEYNADSVVFFIVLGFTLGTIFSLGVLFDFTSIPGTNNEVNVNDLNDAKKKCEMAIPRNNFCHLEWRYVPNAVEEN